MDDSAAFAIETLTRATRAATVRLLRQVFPDEGLIDRLNIALLGTPLQGLARLYGVRDQRVWTAKDASGAVLGVTGLYLSDDDAEAVWLGWFCVAPEARGQGVGGALLDFSIAEARRTGRRRLRLSTSTDRGERAAQALYDSRGFAIIERHQPLSWIGSGIEELIRERPLS